MSDIKNLKNNIFERNLPVENEFLNIPLIGKVRSNDSSGDQADYQLIDIITNYQKQNSDRIALEAMDDALCKAGILAQDILTIDLKCDIKDKDIVVFKIGERLFVRRFFSNHNSCRFETADNYPAQLIIDKNTPGFQIIGKVISVTRQF